MIAGRAPLRPRLVLGEETLAAGEARVGGKALGLGRLVAAGARVPAWLVVPVEIFTAALDGAGLSETFERTLAELSALDAGDATPAHRGGVDDAAGRRRPVARRCRDRARAQRRADAPRRRTVRGAQLDGG
ncbi:MAG: hypothetical protein ACXVDD_11515 [Polyangia bacterium]